MTEKPHGGRDMGTDTKFRSGTQIWGQTRCPMCRSGTFNVERSTLNFYRGDRKGAWWPGYGDRHGIWTIGLLTRWTCPSAGRAVEAGCGHPDMGTGTMSDIPIRNVQRETFNSQCSTGWPKGRMVGGMWGQTRSSDTEFGRSDS